MARLERTIKRLWILAIILIALLAATNGAWIWYESQWEIVEETTSTEVTQDADGYGNNTYYGGNYYGSSDRQNDNDNEVQNP